MRKLFLLAAIGLVLSGCSQNDVPADGPNAQPTQSVPHFYGYALPDDSAPATRGVADGTKIWPKEVVKNGLTVKFLDGSAASQAFVKDAANEWAKYANVKFNFLEDNTQPALVRITFDNASLTSWALTGTDHARVTDQTQATVQFGNWFRLDDRFKRNEVLRAFGQVLGLDLEFRHPKFHPTWITDANGNIDEAKIRTYWEEQLNSFLSWEELKKKYVIDPLEDHSLLIRSTDEYDPNSVMTWPFYEMLAENIPVLDYDDYPVNELSELDKEFHHRALRRTRRQRDCHASAFDFIRFHRQEIRHAADRRQGFRRRMELGRRQRGPVGRPGKRGVLLSDGCDRRLYPYNHPQFQRLHEKEGGRVRKSYGGAQRLPDLIQAPR